MKPSLRQKIYISVGILVIVVHLVVAAIARPSFALTIYGDANPCLLLFLGMLAARENFRDSPGILPLFWKLYAGGLAIMLFSRFIGSILIGER